jgi:methyl-accepting chemotaxis protein
MYEKRFLFSGFIFLTLLIVAVFAFIHPFSPITAFVIIILFLIVAFYFYHAKVIKKRERSIADLRSQLKEKEKYTEELQASLNNYRSMDLAALLQAETKGEFRKSFDSLRLSIEKVSATFTENNNLEQPATEISAIQSAWENLSKSGTDIQENTTKAFEISDNLSASAKAAFEISEKVQNGINIITAALNDTLKFSELLNNQSQEISKVIEILTDISSKINLLSINASIVSARAGIHGTPFEVVAKEIRKLAEGTDTSLNQIENQIRGIQDVISEVVAKIRHAASETDEEKKSLISVVGTLRGITLGVEVFRAVSKIAKEKSEQQKEILETIHDRFDKLNGKIEMLLGLYNNIRNHAQDFKELQELNNIITHMLNPNGKNRGG